MQRTFLDYTNISFNTLKYFGFLVTVTTLKKDLILRN